ncbi:serine/threonine-protein kinase [Streptomyces sp. NPDC004111]|uniref:serine/threonine-protein kinase n=1 Tax=Streptomyces sp. NPDC004111 TaxID=3364690 RepID=UPI0036C3EB47
MATGENERLAGRYRVIEQLGRGGMGVVWRAVDEVLGREVAVKELRTYSDASGPELADLQVRMQREARAAARIRHPGVISVHDIAEHEGRPLIVMELVDGPSLDDVLTRKGLLDPREAAAMGARVLDALGAAHRVGVLHRDVKPGNVLLDVSGRTVLTDFGIAAIDDPGDGSTTHLTRSGELVGSLDYLAPERAQGQEPGPASDIWALGATLYAAVEGGSPFRRTSTWSTLNAIVVEPLPEPVRSGPLAPVLSLLMAKDPAARPDAEEAARLLRAVAEPASGAPSGPAGGGYRPSPQPGFGPAVHPGHAPAPAPAPAPYVQPSPGFGPHTPSGYGTGPGPAVPAGYGHGPAPAPVTTTPLDARGRDGASGGRRRSVVAAGVAAVLLVGAGATYVVSTRGGDETVAGSPAAHGSGTAGGGPTEDGPLAPGALPTDAAKKTEGPAPDGKNGDKNGDKGKNTGTPRPTPSAGGRATDRATTGGTAAGGKGSGASGGANGTGASGGSGGGAAAGGGGGAAAGGGAGGAAAGGGNQQPPPAPAPVCDGIGGGKYNCDVWRTSDSVRANGDRAGTLKAGTNYFYCQTNLGRRVTYGNWTNVWWARTDDDSGNTNVYVSVVYLKGGDNDKPLPGLPTC